MRWRNDSRGDCGQLDNSGIQGRGLVTIDVVAWWKARYRYCAWWVPIGYPPPAISRWTHAAACYVNHVILDASNHSTVEVSRIFKGPLGDPLSPSKREGKREKHQITHENRLQTRTKIT